VDEPVVPAEEFTGTAEEIKAQRELAERLKVKAFADKNPLAMREWRRENLRLARMLRRKGNPGEKKNLRVGRATVAERIARSATLEAAGIIEDTARVLRAGVNVYGKIASTELADYLRERLTKGDAREKREAARDLMDIYSRSLDLLQMNQQRAKRRQAIATWPAEGEKG
jgi:hypothetical protein